MVWTAAGPFVRSVFTPSGPSVESGNRECARKRQTVLRRTRTLGEFGNTRSSLQKKERIKQAKLAAKKLRQLGER